MGIQNLIPGLKFAKKHMLTQKEIQILIPFFEKEYTAQQLSDYLNLNIKSLHAIIQRLRIRNILKLKDRDKVGTYMYELNLE